MPELCNMQKMLIEAIISSFSNIINPLMTKLTQLTNQFLVPATTYFLNATNANKEKASTSTTSESKASSSESNSQLPVPTPTYCINTANLNQAQVQLPLDTKHPPPN